MIRRHVLASVLGVYAFAGASLIADVRTQDKVLVKFEGGVGKVINFFGGKAMKEGVTTTVALKGDRKARFGDTEGTIVDLGEEKVYTLEMKKKTYTVMTFADMRRRIEEARKRAEEEVRKAQAEEAKAPEKNSAPKAANNEKPPEVEVDFNVKETGAHKTINGFDTREVVMTMTLREKGKTLEESGGLMMTSDMWIAPTVAAMKELMEFDIRYAKQLQLPETFGASVEQMQTAIAAHPMLKQGLARMSEESAKMEGTTILTVVSMDAVQSAEQMAAAEKQKSEDTKPSTPSAPPTTVGGLIGGFGRRMAQKKAEGDKGAGNTASAPKSQATFMTVTNERLSIATSVAAGDVAIPAGFREEK
jgi:vacuolar-type H+-ATPase subunit D/Vma8